MPTIYIDNAPYTVGEGQNLLHACLGLGFDIPHFCWHPAMHSVGSCRLCAVKLFADEHDTKGKIVMSCMTAARDGTRLSINDPEAARFRAGVIELLMTNHPHDCPVCDEGGECHLQDMTVMTGHVYRSFRFTKRTHVNQDLGPFVHHEMNRCIACYRCVRFYRDLAGGTDLSVFGSHEDVYFGRAESGTLQSALAGNLVEVCPTGVFTDKTLRRHFVRKWDLQSAPSVCVHCSVGCTTLASERAGELRCIRNRFNFDVNGYFICDRGRFGYEFVNNSGRLRRPLLRDECGMRTVSREEALDKAISLLAAGKAAGIGSPRASLEANYALQRIVGKDNFYSGHSPQHSRVIGLIRRIAAHGPAPLASLRQVSEADAILVLGEDCGNAAPMLGFAVRQAIAGKKYEIAKSHSIDSWNDAAVRNAAQDSRHPLFIATVGPTDLDSLAAGAFRHGPAGIADLGFTVAHTLTPSSPQAALISPELEEQAALVAAALRTAHAPVVVAGCMDERIVKAAANVAWALGGGARLFFALPACNSMGLEMLGPRPLDELTGASGSGGNTLVVLEAELERVLTASQIEDLGLRFTTWIVLDHQEGPTVRRATLALPAATFAESDGTMVSCEARAQRFYKVFVAGEGVQESWRWLRNMGKLEWESLDQIRTEMCGAVPELARAGEASLPASYRVKGRTVPRLSHRASGRTALQTTASVAPLLPDEESALGFSMEGFQSVGPSAGGLSAGLTTRYWAPGWNSVQSLNKYQRPVGGKLKGNAENGVRLIDSPAGRPPQFFEWAPQEPLPKEHDLFLAQLPHAFGSEELSATAPGVAELAPAPYLVLNPVDAGERDIRDGDLCWVLAPAAEVRLPARIERGMAAGVAAIPLGVVAFPPAPCSVSVVKEVAHD